MPSLMFVRPVTSQELKPTDTQKVLHLTVLTRRCRLAGPPSIMSGLSTSVQPAEPASPIELLCGQQRKVNVCVRYHKFLYSKKESSYPLH